MTGARQEAGPKYSGEVISPQGAQEDQVDLVQISTGKGRGRVYDLYAAEGVSDAMFRVRKGRKPGRQHRPTLRSLVSLAEEAAFIDQYRETVIDPMTRVAQDVKSDLGTVTGQTGIDGVYSLEGNYNTTFVPGSSVRMNPKAVHEGLKPEDRKGVVSRGRTITIFLAEDGLRSRRGRRSVREVYRGVVRLLQEQGASRSQAYQRVKTGESYTILDEDKVMALHRSGVLTKGVSIADKSRVEVDPVRDHDGISVSRPSSIDERLRRLREVSADSELDASQDFPPVL